MSQVSHASHIVQLLGTKDVSQEELIKQLKTQLSHSDGIRGFFVTYSISMYVLVSVLYFVLLTHFATNTKVARRCVDDGFVYRYECGNANGN